MTVLWITVLLSALLAFVFIALFVRDQARAASRRHSGPEQAALLPLQEPVERRTPAGSARAVADDRSAASMTTRGPGQLSR